MRQTNKKHDAKEIFIDQFLALVRSQRKTKQRFTLIKMIFTRAWRIIRPTLATWTLQSADHHPTDRNLITLLRAFL